MPIMTIKDLKDYLEAYEGGDTDPVYGVLTGQPGKADDDLANFISTYLQPNLSKMQLGFFACANLPTTLEEAQKLRDTAFFFSTP